MGSQRLLFLIIMILTISCGQEKFTAGKYQQSSTSLSQNSALNTDQSHAKFTLVRPKVDFLILIDNSSSFQTHLDKNIQASLSNLLSYISKDFDYQITIAPLISQSLSEYYVIDYDSSNLSYPATSKLIPLGDADTKILTFSLGSGKEEGLDRTKDMLLQAYNNNTFRKEAHHIVTLISNGDQIKGDEPIPANDQQLAVTKYYEIKNVVDNQLESLHFRFLTIVPHSSASCGGIKATSGVYRYVSALFYELVPASFKAYDTNDDSFDICQISDFQSAFNSINQSIQPEVLRHTYDYWPLILTNKLDYFDNQDFDQNNIEVRKIYPNGSEEILSASTSNGFEYIGYRSNQNIREKINGFENRGEPYTGFFIRLYGNSKVTFPVYLKIKVPTRPHYYGYVVMDNKPNLSSIKLYINGSEIPQNSTNGWEYIGGPSTRNIRIKSPSNPSADSPEVRKTGYFLKVHGNAVYSNDANINIQYFPQS